MFFEPTYRVRFLIEIQFLLCTYTPRFDPHFVKNSRFVCVYLKKFVGLMAIQTHPHLNTNEHIEQYKKLPNKTRIMFVLQQAPVLLLNFTLLTDNMDWARTEVIFNESHIWCYQVKHLTQVAQRQHLLSHYLICTYSCDWNDEKHSLKFNLLITSKGTSVLTTYLHLAYKQSPPWKYLADISMNIFNDTHSL